MKVEYENALQAITTLLASIPDSDDDKMELVRALGQRIGAPVAMDNYDFPLFHGHLAFYVKDLLDEDPLQEDTTPLLKYLMKHPSKLPVSWSGKIVAFPGTEHTGRDGRPCVSAFDCTRPRVGWQVIELRENRVTVGVALAIAP